MAFSQWINGNTPATGAAALWDVISMLIAAGASKLADSDGSTYSSSGTQVTSGASGAGGLGNTSAWVRIQLPGGRELTFQRGSANTLWRVKYSASAYFTGGSPSATQTPTATDGQVRLGGGTDASPTYSTWFATDASYKLYGGAGGAADGFWVGTSLISGGASSSGMFLDPLAQIASGDADGSVIALAVSGATFTRANLANATAAVTGAGVYSWLKYGLSGAGYVAMPAMIVGDSTGDVWPLVAGANPHTGKDALRMIEYARRSSLVAPVGPKGVGSLAAWNASARSTLETYTVDATRDRIVFGDVSFPWSGAAVA